MSPVDSPIHRPTTPPSIGHHAASLDDTLAENEDAGERIRNRMWRTGKTEAYLHHGGHGGHVQIRDGHVENKIEAALPKTEAPAAARSRKASHYLRVFKENDAAEEQKKREGRTKERRQADRVLQSLHEEHAARSSTSALTEQLQKASRPGSAVQSPNIEPTHSYFDVTPKSAPREGSAGRADHVHEFPARLLEEIRNFHNLTPGAERGSSFSRSLPTAAAEKLRAHALKARPTSTLHESPDYFRALQADSPEHSPGSDEDESEREQISSALYFPHRQLKSPGEAPKEEEARKAKSEAIRRLSSVSAGKGTNGWGKEEPVKTRQEVEISLQSQDTNQCLHGDIQATNSIPQDDSKSLASATTDATTSAESEYESLAESSYSLNDDESSATDDLGTTPTATPRKHEKKSIASAQPPAPLGAVELKPYDHQVGGHTTVYRFSRRAVCKQLNNRENEFYETVERQHPELLEFLPRYAHVPLLVVSLLNPQPRNPPALHLLCMC